MSLKKITAPDKLKVVSSKKLAGEPFNVGQMYANFARSIRDKRQHVPSFSTALKLHHLIDLIQEISWQKDCIACTTVKYRLGCVCLCSVTILNRFGNTGTLMVIRTRLMYRGMKA